MTQFQALQKSSYNFHEGQIWAKKWYHDTYMTYNLNVNS